MPQNYDIPCYIKQKKKWKSLKKTSFLFVFCVIVIASLLIFNFADIVSSAITGEGSLIYSSKIKILNKTLFALSFGNFKDENSAKILTQEIFEQGGAGYVYSYGGYYVLGAIYPSLTSAEEVLQNLKSDNVEAEIININIPLIEINYKGKNLEILKNGIEQVFNLYSYIYELSLEYDRGNKTSSSVKNESTKIYSMVQTHIDTLSNNIEKEYEDIYNKLIKINEKIKENIGEILFVRTTDYQLNAYLKQIYCKVVDMYLSFAREM